jgi:ribulose-5-phosphate 4-epimerase/fuculose-1-phosphate aldolase
MRLALDGIPVYDRPVLISRDELAREMLGSMGEKSVCILRGHGIVSVGPTVRAAVVAAVNLNDVCTVAVELRKMGADPRPLGPEDLAELPNLGSAFDDDLAWQALVADLEEPADKEEGD